MNNYRPFDQLRTNELTVVRHGWLNSWYELTDGQLTYGTITYGLFRRRHAIVETATHSWILDKALFSRVLTITKPGGELVGKVTQDVFSRSNKLMLSNNFAAELRRTGFFPTEFTWSSILQGDLLRAVHHPFRFSRPITITLNPTVKIAETPLLAFLSIQVILLRQRRKAAAH